MHFQLTNLLPGSIHENIQTIHETVNKMPLSPAANMYLRLLGHEVGFVTLDDVVRMVPKVNLTKDGLMQMAMKVGFQILVKLILIYLCEKKVCSKE